MVISIRNAVNDRSPLSVFKDLVGFEAAWQPLGLEQVRTVHQLKMWMWRRGISRESHLCNDFPDLDMIARPHPDRTMTGMGKKRVAVRVPQNDEIAQGGAISALELGLKLIPLVSALNNSGRGRTGSLSATVSTASTTSPENGA